MNPNSYVTQQASSQETVTTPVNTLETQTTALTPFWESSDEFWTSDGVRKTGTLGYAYPETQSWNFATPAEYSANVRATVRRLYGGSSLGSILAESTPGNLSNRAKLIVPSISKQSVKPASNETVQSASKETVQPASKENVQPGKPSAAEPSKATSSTATSSKATNTPLSFAPVKDSDQKPLGEVKPQQEPKAQPKPEDLPKTEPNHGNNPKRKSRSITIALR